MEAENGMRGRERLGRILLPAVATIPFLWSLFAYAVGPRPQVPAEGNRRPALAFDQYLVNLGRVEPQRVVAGYFRFTNRSEQTVRLTKLDPSCGCLRPRLEKRTYRPQESGQLRLRVQTAGQDPGRHEHHLDVHYKSVSGNLDSRGFRSKGHKESPNPQDFRTPSKETRSQTVRLTFKFALPQRQVFVRPRALFVYQGGSQATTKTITVTDSRRQPLQVTGVECASQFVTAQVEQTGTDSSQSRQTKIPVTIAAEVPSGRHRAVLRIRTDDAAYPELRVPLLIEGPEQPASAKSSQSTGAQGQRG